MGSKTHEFKVEMTCEGCSSAVERVLQKKSGIENIEVDLSSQKVSVMTHLPAEEILECIKKSGKPVSLIKTSG